MTRLRKTGTFILAACAVALSTPAAAQWQFEVTPYLWGAGMKGNAQAGQLPRTHVDMSFLDILSNLDFGAMGAFEARRGRWGFLFDGIYMKVSDSATVGPGPLNTTIAADATVKQKMFAGAVAYRVSDGPTLVDVIGGARYTKLDVKALIEPTFFGLIPGPRITRTGNKSWTDGYVGVRVQHPIADRWMLVGYGDVGAGGSDSTYQLSIGAKYAYSKETTINFGYRYFTVDYNKGGFLYDMDSAGLYFGASFLF